MHVGLGRFLYGRAGLSLRGPALGLVSRARGRPGRHGAASRSYLAILAPEHEVRIATTA